MRWWLRLIGSIACGGLIVALAVLWVRSYQSADRLHGVIKGRQSFVFASKAGQVSLVLFQWHGAPGGWKWEARSYPVDDELSFPAGYPVNHFGFGWLSRPIYFVMRPTQTLPDGTQVTLFGAATATLNGSGPVVPYWFLTLLPSVVLAALQVRRWRFTVRWLLVVTALFCVVLGLAAFLGGG